MFKTFEFLALISSALYCGSTAYVTLVEHPARQACSAEVAVIHWMQSTRSGPLLGVRLRVVSLGSFDDIMNCSSADPASPPKVEPQTVKVCLQQLNKRGTGEVVFQSD